MAGTMTLVEFSKECKDVLVKSIVDVFLYESMPMRYIPWETIGRLYAKNLRMQTLPSVGTRKLNASWSSSTGTTEHVEDQLALLGGNIDLDKEMVEDGQTIEDLRTTQQYMKSKAMAYYFNNLFINGSVLTSPEYFNGLKYRCDLSEMSAQKLLSATAGNLLDDTTAHALTFLKELDRLYYAIDGHKPTFLQTNDQGLLVINSALRASMMMRLDRDHYGELVTMMPSGIPIYDSGVTADQSTRIMTYETVAGVNGSSTDYYFSIYAVRVGEKTEFWGIQKHPLEVLDKGLLEDAVTYRTNVNWPVGLALVNKRSIARLYGIRYK